MQTHEPLHIDSDSPRPMRAMNLANALVARGHQVVLWTSAFSHQKRTHRTREHARVAISPQLSIDLIPSPGYQRNIGPGRLWDHWILARNLQARLDLELSPPNVALIGYPPIETADVMSRWLMDRGVPMVLDVKDQWPTHFLDPFPRPLKLPVRVLLAGYFRMARRTIRRVSGITSMTKSFVQWALELGDREPCPADRVVPLVPPSSNLSDAALAEARVWWDALGCKVEDGMFRLFFVGTHSKGFDFGPIQVAAAECQASRERVQFVICGDGPENAALRSAMSGLTNVEFPGWIDEARIATLAERSQAALAPYRNIENFTKNVPNKIVDYLSLGVPILSSLGGEVEALITPRMAGLRYGGEGGPSLKSCIDALREDPAKRAEMSRNAIALHDERFTFDRVYGGLVSHLEDLARSAR